VAALCKTGCMDQGPVWVESDSWRPKAHCRRSMLMPYQSVCSNNCIRLGPNLPTGIEGFIAAFTKLLWPLVKILIL